MGRIANKHLAKLWDFMVFYNLNSGDHSVDIFEAFLECDEALSELQDQCEHWKTMYGNACGDQDVLKESIRLLDGENRRLMAEKKDWERRCDDLRGRMFDMGVDSSKTINQLRQENEDLKKEYKSLQGLNLDIITKHNEEMRQLREENDELKKRCEDLRKHNVDVITVNNKTIDQLREDNETLASAVSGKDDELQDAKKNVEYFRHSRDNWRARAKHAEAEVEELKSRLNSIYGTELPDAKEEYTMTFAMDRENFDKLMAVIKEGIDNVKSVGDIRAFLKAFCEDHDSCRVCPLKECGSDLGRDFDSMSDEEIEKYYKIAIGAQPEREKPDLTFGDIVKVPWSHSDYIFIEALTSSIRLYSITKRRFVIVAKNEHLKWVGHIKK